MRPFDFEGRNEYRKTNGFNPSEGLAIKLLDSLSNFLSLFKKKENLYHIISFPFLITIAAKFYLIVQDGLLSKFKKY